MQLLAVAALLIHGAWAGPDDAAGWGDLSDFAQAAEPAPVHEARLYGFIDAYWEAVANAPEGIDENGETQWGGGGHEFDIPNMVVMLQGSLHGKYRYFLNLTSPGSGSATSDEPVQVRNAWVEAPIYGGYLKVRAGKLYRRFGLYNEILDAVPTFIGIEPPELFDKDHLMLTRTTNLMLFGEATVGAGTLNYALTTGNDERTGGAIPLGADVHYLTSVIKVGSSFYTTGGPAAPSRSVGEGSPRGGVANWMAEDRYVIYGGYVEATPGNLVVQAEYWQADHNATRDPEAVAQLAEGGLNERQLNRFFQEGDPANGTRNPNVQYGVRTAYLRAGYQVPVGAKGSVTPYLQGDYYANPEIVESKDLGGDAEAGQSDDGSFLKYTVGTVIRPVPEIALKLDGSAHQLQYNGATVFYPEVRVSFSYLWQFDL